MSKCQCKGCMRDASHAPRVNVPIHGMPEALATPVQVIIMLALCRRHVGETTVEEFMRPGLIEFVDRQARHQMRSVDFTRAHIDSVTLDSPQYRALLKREGDDANLAAWEKQTPARPS